MPTTISIALDDVARALSLRLEQVETVVALLDAGNTVPFVTRYRKDQTGGLDEEQIRQIQARVAKTRQLAERKQTILRSIESQGKLTPELRQQIEAADTPKRLEDLYLPFKPKKQTLATTARQRGLEPLALEILSAAPEAANLDGRAHDFINPDRSVPTAADALLGAGHILAEMFSERADLRQALREILHKTGKLVTSAVEAEPPAEKNAKPTNQNRQQTRIEAAQADTAARAEAAEQARPAAAEASSEAIESRGPAGPSDLAIPESEPQARSSEAAAEAPAKAEPGVRSESPPRTEPTVEALAEVAATGVPETIAIPGSQPPTAITRLDEGGKPAAGHHAVSPAPGQGADEAPTDEGREPPDESRTSLQEPPAPDEPTSLSHSSPPHSESSSPPSNPESAGGTENQPGEASVAPAAAEPLSDVPAAAAAPDVETAPAASASGANTVKPVASRKPQEKPAKKQTSKKDEKQERFRRAFRDYFDYSEALDRLPPHRILAINRGEYARVLRVRLEADLDAMRRTAEELLVPAEHPHLEFLRGCAADALHRLVLPGLEREVRRELTDTAEAHAVQVFARNLRKLLLQAPVHNRRVLAIDPGYKSGCKLVALDEFGNVLDHALIHIIGSHERKAESRAKVLELIGSHQVSVVAIGNGTGCRETEMFIADIIAGELADQGVAYVIVNEAGASVYSTSAIGREELPDFDPSVRSAISIGRRLQDPLSELVKIDPANLGVGLYQHDIKAKHLRASLDEVVESCVNYVGVELNTASISLLRYVSGLNQLTSRRLVEYRQEQGPFKSREELKKVPGFGEATFVQAAGFLRIAGGHNPLDSTWIHPESYEATRRVLDKLGATVEDLKDKQGASRVAEQATRARADELARELDLGLLLLQDILAQLARPGRDPREDLPPPIFKRGVLKLEDLQPGMELSGSVLNVVDFGAFVDIGLKDSGLVHVSRLSKKYVPDPHEVVSVGDIVRVWVVDVDKQRRRVSLTMVEPGTEAPPRRPPRPEGKPQPPRRPHKPRPAAVAGQKMEARKPHAAARPRPKPKPPARPLTKEMKEGKEPLRTFGDLKQFFELRKEKGEPEG